MVSAQTGKLKKGGREKFLLPSLIFNIMICPYDEKGEPCHMKPTRKSMTPCGRCNTFQAYVEGFGRYGITKSEIPRRD